MATLTDIVDRVTAWTAANICEKVKLKAPPEDEAADGAGYEYNLVTPACFPFFVPGSDKLPPGVSSPFPNACVRIVEGEDGRSTGEINLEIMFSVWNPGTHGRDVLKPVEGLPDTFREWNDDEAAAYYSRNAEGWRDLWNWIDTALRELESAASIDGLKIDRERGFRFGPLKDENGIPDMWPFYFGFVGFTINRPIVRNIKEYDDML